MCNDYHYARQKVKGIAADQDQSHDTGQHGSVIGGFGKKKYETKERCCNEIENITEQNLSIYMSLLMIFII